MSLGIATFKTRGSLRTVSCVILVESKDKQHYKGRGICINGQTTQVSAFVDRLWDDTAQETLV